MISTINTFEDYDEKVAAASKQKPVVLQFFATWCGPCEMLKPVMEGLAKNDNRWDLVFIDIEQHMDKASEFQVRSVPKVVLVSNGKEVSNFVGGQPKHVIEKWLNEHLPDKSATPSPKSATSSAATFIMFSGKHAGKAEEAIRLYTSLFDNSAIGNIEYFKDGEQGGKEGQVKKALFTIGGQQFMAHDSAMEHAFDINPTISIHMTLSSETKQTEVFQTLSQGGQVHLPLDSYGFSKRYAWVEDKYGLSWQLNLD